MDIIGNINIYHKYMIDNIDWKLFRHIQRLLTKYQDMGYVTTVSVSIYQNNYLESIYREEFDGTNSIEDFDQTNRETRLRIMKAFAEGEKLNYFFKIFPKENNYKNATDTEKAIILKLKNEALTEIKKKYKIIKYIINTTFSSRFYDYEKIN